jgi:hypothetical protein
MCWESTLGPSTPILLILDGSPCNFNVLVLHVVGTPSDRKPCLSRSNKKVGQRQIREMEYMRAVILMVSIRISTKLVIDDLLWSRF